MNRILPILFNQEMVRAIMDGRKTVTRRIIKRRGYTEKINDARNDYACRVSNNLFQIGYRLPTRAYPQESVGVFPQYQVGDILYVRESYHPNYFDSDTGWGNNHAYKADYEAVRGEIPEPKWKPSIHMPKEAARIWLKVTAVRAERLQDITEEQAVKEGTMFFKPSVRYANFKSKWLSGVCSDCAKSNPFDLSPCRDMGRKFDLIEYCGCTLGFKLRADDDNLEPARLRFFAYLDYMAHKSKNYEMTLHNNPWVWVIEFERCEEPEEVTARIKEV